MEIVPSNCAGLTDSPLLPAPPRSQYVTSVAISENVSQLTPQASIQKVKLLLGSGNFPIQPSVLSISNRSVTIKDGRTSSAVNTFPLNSVAMVQVGGVAWRGGGELCVYHHLPVTQ